MLITANNTCSTMSTLKLKTLIRQPVGMLITPSPRAWASMMWAVLLLVGSKPWSTGRDMQKRQMFDISSPDTTEVKMHSSWYISMNCISRATLVTTIIVFMIKLSRVIMFPGAQSHRNLPAQLGTQKSRLQKLEPSVSVTPALMAQVGIQLASPVSMPAQTSIRVHIMSQEVPLMVGLFDLADSALVWMLGMVQMMKMASGQMWEIARQMQLLSWSQPIKLAPIRVPTPDMNPLI